jgi:hypothetical protein
MPDNNGLAADLKKLLSDRVSRLAFLFLHTDNHITTNALVIFFVFSRDKKDIHSPPND